MRCSNDGAIRITPSQVPSRPSTRRAHTYLHFDERVGALVSVYR